MTHEIELYFGERQEDGSYDNCYMTLTPVCFATNIELENFAYSEMRKQKAIAVSFGPIVPRDSSGKPA